MVWSTRIATRSWLTPSPPTFAARHPFPTFPRIISLLSSFQAQTHRRARASHRRHHAKTPISPSPTATPDSHPLCMDPDPVPRTLTRRWPGRRPMWTACLTW
ncbi:hypothetical protein BDM02DRAFT_1282127 [Thelephora ganbajun]|uniref:Uncharacterized protein n=1 Tax=Thelephora ganbajun TaxID=370292 RepID=A0ACB6Z3B8_THEGA|nr:hypothetical protein BDM02DRAFT_1282127 [Thelephora ganbajun]